MKFRTNLDKIQDTPEKKNQKKIREQGKIQRNLDKKLYQFQMNLEHDEWGKFRQILDKIQISCENFRQNQVVL